MRQFLDDVLGTVRQSSGSFSFKTVTADGVVRGYFRGMEGQVPSSAQLDFMRAAVRDAERLKRLAVAFVRNEVLTRPDRYGLLEEEGRPAPWAAPYFQMSEAEYFDDFRLESLVVEGQDPRCIRMTYATELDPEHGVPVLFCEGQPLEAFA
ncbi:hypothetical protein V3W47_11845 [Deinococcus sp. YIM 134068]|uniref:hypothetical protein n=1 Tax=Deinococcus lichenicola TaxID=3118910 RepID=UPI002F92F240